MSVTFMHRTSALAIASAALAVPSTSAAQTAPSAIEENVGLADGGPANPSEIVVTATRRSERLQDVPISVTAVRGDTLQQRGVTSPEELARLTPTLTSASGAANQQGTNFSIRGVGTASFQRTIESSVATVIDDVTLIRPEMGILNFTDVEQVEVLNGPQGMLFGKNASAGVVSVRTRNPILGEASGRVGAEYGRLNTSNNTSQVRVFGIANLPVSPTVAARFNLLYQDNSSLYRNTAVNPGFEGGLRQIVGAGKLLWQPDDKLSVLVAGDYMDAKGLGPGVGAFRSVSPGSPNGFFLASVGITPGPDNDFSAYDLPTYANTKIGGGQVKIVYELGGGHELTNIAAYRKFTIKTQFDPDYGPFPLVQEYREPRGFSQWSNELRLASPTGGAFDYQVGLYALQGKLFQHNIAAAFLGMVPPPGFTTFLGIDGLQEQKLGSYAVFGQATYRLTDALRVIGGARLTYDEIKMRLNITSNGAVAPLFPLANNVTADRNNTNVSWRGIVQYDVNRDVMIYGTAATGYKGPGFSQFSVQYVRPETSTHYEIGAKTQFLDRRVTLNVSAYHTAFKDFQAQALDFSTLTIFVQNAGKLVTKGFDAQLTAQPTRGLTLSGGVAYTDARYRSFVGDLCYTGQPTCLGGITDSSGNRLPNAPEWKGVGNLRYEWAFTPSLNGNIQFGITSQSGIEYSSNANPNTHQDGFTLFDVAVGLAGRPDSWQLNLFCRNCTDKRFAGYIAGHPLVTSDYLQNFSYGAFRSLGASLEFSF